MALINLKRILSQDHNAVARIFDEIAAQNGSPMGILDPDGFMLWGSQNPLAGPKLPVVLNEQILGWVIGSPADARLLSLLAEKEAEKHALADEALNRYREINLLYTLSETVAQSHDQQTIFSVASEKARRLIKFSTAAVMLLDDQNGVLTWLAGMGVSWKNVPFGEGIIGRVANTVKGEILNDLCDSTLEFPWGSGLCAVLCAPLVVNNRLIGVIVLGRTDPVPYTAGELKLLSTLATQFSPAIENAQRYARMMKESTEREERLRQQIETLRSELNENRQSLKVSQITETEYFQDLQRQADRLRDIIDGPGSM